LKTGCGGEYRGKKREDVTGDWRKLHNEELHNLYSTKYLGSSNQRILDGRGM
jgi:hypothetical protein